MNVNGGNTVQYNPHEQSLKPFGDFWKCKSLYHLGDLDFICLFSWKNTLFCQKFIIYINIMLKRKEVESAEINEWPTKWEIRCNCRPETLDSASVLL